MNINVDSVLAYRTDVNLDIAISQKIIYIIIIFISMPWMRLGTIRTIFGRLTMVPKKKICESMFKKKRKKMV